MNGVGWTSRRTCGLHAFINTVITVVALHRLLRDGVHVDRTVRASINTASMPTARVVVHRDCATSLFVQGTARTSLYARCVFAMLARHRQEHASDLRIFSYVLVDRLANEVAERHIVLGFASDFTAVATKATTCINKPAVLLAVIRRGHAIAPAFLRLKERVLFCCGLVSGGIFQSSQRHQRCGRCSKKLATVGIVISHRCIAGRQVIINAYG